MSAGRRVLIVEDEHIVRLHLRVIVQELGYTVTGLASTAADALASAAQTCPDLVLMDVRLAGERDGVEAARALRATCDPAVVFLTAFADEETVQRAREIGAAGYLVKPFSKPQLRATLATALTEHDKLRQARRGERSLATLLAAPEQRGANDAATRPFGEGARLALFSHDTFGLGHLQRSLNIAWALSQRYRGLSTLLITGSPAVHRFEMPPGLDYVKLPSVRKVASERYAARSLEMSDEGVLRFRANLALRAVQDFDPDVLLVDHAPLGMGGELLPTLEWLQRNRPRCARVVGLRDVVDEPEAVVRAWRDQGVWDALERLYEHVLVYGTREVHDITATCRFPASIARKTRYCGYVGQLRPGSAEIDRQLLPDGDGPLVVVTIGGGDGAGREVLGGWLEMLRRSRDRVDFRSLLLTGPFLEPELLERFQREAADLPARVVPFVPSTTPWLAHADLVVATCGYNTMTETLRVGRRALVIPRVLHRHEQLMRAQLLAAKGWVALLHPDEASPERLHEEVVRLLADPHEPLSEARASGQLRFDGNQQVVEFLAGLQVADRPGSPAPC